MAFVGMPVGAIASGPSDTSRKVTKKQDPPKGGQQTGRLDGVAKNAQQQNLPSVRIQVRAANGQLAASGTTNGAGQFSFAGLPAGTYTVEIVNVAGEIVGTASVTIAAGSTAVVTISATAAGTIAAAGGGAGLFGLGAVATVAVLGAAGATTIVAIKAANNDASGSR